MAPPGNPMALEDAPFGTECQMVLHCPCLSWPSAHFFPCVLAAGYNLHHHTGPKITVGMVPSACASFGFRLNHCALGVAFWQCILMNRQHFWWCGHDLLVAQDVAPTFAASCACTPPPLVVPHPREDGPPPTLGGRSPRDGPPPPPGEPHYHRTRTFAATEIAA